MSSEFKHPELLEGEVFLNNIVNEEEFADIPWQTKRMGVTAYNIAWEETSGCPVFVQRSEYEAAGNVCRGEYNVIVEYDDGDYEGELFDGDHLLARMQTPKSREAMQKAFSASPEELGRAAVSQASRKKSEPE